MAKKIKDKLKSQRLKKRREAYRDMPKKEYEAMRAREKATERIRRNNETPERRERRLAPQRERARRRLASESPADRKARLEYLRLYKPNYSAANRVQIKAQSLVYYALNRDKAITNGKAYRKANLKKASLRERARRGSDPMYALAGRLRCRLRNSLERVGAIRAARTFELVGCSQPDLVKWIEKQFLPGMGWHNRAQWHLDHVVPVSAFDLFCAGQQEVAFHYTNLRPLWACENIIKADKLPVPQRKLFWDLSDIAEARLRLASINIAGPRPRA